jgi:hypothetical protein
MKSIIPVSISHGVLALIFLVGCSANEPDPGVRLLYTDPAEVTRGQTITGPLVINGRCLAVVDDVTDTRFELVWPSEGTQWDASTNTVSLNGTSASVGDLVTVVGGQTADSGDDDIVLFAPAPPAECITRSQWRVARIEGVTEPAPAPASDSP